MNRPDGLIKPGSMPAQDHRDEAGEVARARILRDRDRVSDDLVPIVEYVANHLLAPDLDLDHLVRTCELDQRLRERFRVQLGIRPDDYIRHRKMETAAWLLRRTDLRVPTIAGFLHYSRCRDFTHDFKRWSGHPPIRYRRLPRSSRSPTAGIHSPRTRRRTAAGEPTHAEAQRWLEWLEEQVAGDLHR
jgi:transcriptional regulator GlxA family with amidase domain